MGQAADMGHGRIFNDTPLGQPLVQTGHAFTAVESEILDEDEETLLADLTEVCRSVWSSRSGV